MCSSLNQNASSLLRCSFLQWPGCPPASPLLHWTSTPRARSGASRWTWASHLSRCVARRLVCLGAQDCVRVPSCSSFRCFGWPLYTKLSSSVFPALLGPHAPPPGTPALRRAAVHDGGLPRCRLACSQLPAFAVSILALSLPIRQQVQLRLLQHALEMSLLSSLQVMRP